MEIHVKEPSIAKEKPLQSNSSERFKRFNISKDLNIQCTHIKEGGHNHWLIQFKGSPDWWFVYKPHVQVKWDNLITYRHFLRCFSRAKKEDTKLYFEPFNRTLQEFEINTIQRIAAFTAQIAHETCSLKYKEEIASGVAYDWRKDLGNVYYGDGRKYKGRGLIQLTGRHNYSWASKQLNVDLVNYPERATEPLLSARIAGLYWQSRNLNKYADWHSEGGFRLITKRINGGLNGWHDRLMHWQRIRKILCC